MGGAIGNIVGKCTGNDIMILSGFSEQRTSNVEKVLISMGYCKKAVAPLPTHLSYAFVALTHGYVDWCFNTLFTNYLLLRAHNLRMACVGVDSWP